MKMTTDLDLLREYAERGSEKAFAALVARHLDLVYSAALRQVKSSQLAEDIAQSVFTDLARNVHQLKPDTVLAAWLYQVTRRTALNVSRAEGRRQAREQIAVELADMNATSSDWTQIKSWLDEAMETLDEPDRAAILLRYFDNKGLRDVGKTLGVGEYAAQKRVSRAVERLREFFSKRNVTIGASGLVVLISTNAVQAAPVGLAVTISAAAAFAGTTLATATTKTIAMTALQKTLVTVVIMASFAAPLLVQNHAKTSLHEYDNRLRNDMTRLAELQAEKERLSKSLVVTQNSLALPKEQFSEVLKLRGEIARLRSDRQNPAQPQATRLSRDEMLAALARQYSERTGQLKQFLGKNSSEYSAEIEFLTDTDWFWLAGNGLPDTEDGFQRMASQARRIGEQNIAHDVLHPALQRYAQEHNQQFPGDLSQLKLYFNTPMDDAVLQRWQIIHTAQLVHLRDDQLKKEGWGITQKAPVNRALDQRIVVTLKQIHSYAKASPDQWDIAPGL